MYDNEQQSGEGGQMCMAMSDRVQMCTAMSDRAQTCIATMTEWCVTEGRCGRQRADVHGTETPLGFATGQSG
eukprot:1160820-Pelagomonas_calceolata.AAC.2